jgi:hypothetical protein
MGHGILLVFLYINRPETTTILTEEERTLTSLRITVPYASRFPSWVQIKEVVFNPIILASFWFYIIGESLASPSGHLSNRFIFLADNVTVIVSSWQSA